MIRGGRIEVESAPENDQSMDDQENRSYYTVIGIDKEFKKMFFEEEEESASEPSLNRQPLPQKPS